QRTRFRAIVDEQRECSPSRHRLDAERAGAGEEIEYARTFDRVGIGVHKDVEHGLAEAIRGRADVARGRRGQIAALQSSADHAHRLLIPRLQVALAVIAALGTARRAITGILFFVARPRLLAAGALHQYAAALAVRNQRALACGLERLFLARRFPLLALLRPVEFCAGLRDHLLAKLLAQHAGLHFLGLAFLDLAELERAVGHADQPVHLEPEMRHHIAHLAVLALADRKHQPDIGALVALQRGVD